MPPVGFEHAILAGERRAEIHIWMSDVLDGSDTHAISFFIIPRRNAACRDFYWGF
jgi:hypothetical protein